MATERDVVAPSKERATTRIVYVPLADAGNFGGSRYDIAKTPAPTRGTLELTPPTLATTLATLGDVATVPDTTDPLPAYDGETLTL